MRDFFRLWKKNKKIKRDTNELNYYEIKLEEYFIIDVRTKKEYQEGHLNGAINIPLSDIKGKIKDMNIDKKILLYCQSGIRSKKALKILKDLGYNDIYHLKGGLENI